MFGESFLVVPKTKSPIMKPGVKLTEGEEVYEFFNGTPDRVVYPIEVNLPTKVEWYEYFSKEITE
jgi:hypothetical protein